jgi:hypothetical protein
MQGFPWQMAGSIVIKLPIKHSFQLLGTVDLTTAILYPIDIDTFKVFLNADDFSISRMQIHH